jgi:hypothetical protein
MKLYYYKEKHNNDAIAIYNNQKNIISNKISDIITAYVEEVSSGLESVLSDRNKELERVNSEIERREEVIKGLKSRLVEEEYKLRVSDARLMASEATVESLRTEIVSIEGKYQGALLNEAFYKGKFEALAGGGKAGATGLTENE